MMHNGKYTGQNTKNSVKYKYKKCKRKTENENKNNIYL